VARADHPQPRVRPAIAQRRHAPGRLCAAGPRLAAGPAGPSVRAVDGAHTERYRTAVLAVDEKVPFLENDLYCLAQLKHYRSLMPLSYEAHKPVFDLSRPTVPSAATRLRSSRLEPTLPPLRRKSCERWAIPSPPVQPLSGREDAAAGDPKPAVGPGPGSRNDEVVDRTWQCPNRVCAARGQIIMIKPVRTRSCHDGR
jgi:hypothetical protein